MTYMAYIQDFIMKQTPGEPIYIETIAVNLAAEFKIPDKKAFNAVAVAVKRLIDSGKMSDLRCFKKGIYYLTAPTPFGEIGINKEQIIADKYLLPDKGYVTGLRLLYQLGLTSQMPTEYLIATNEAHDYKRPDASLGVSIRPPKAPITSDNIKYLQTLDALSIMDKAPVDAEDPYKIIYEHIKDNGLEFETLLYYADKYYSVKTITQLAHTAGYR